MALSAILMPGCKPSGPDANRFESTPVSRGDLIQRVTASGTLSAVVSVDVGSQVSGKIALLKADFNSAVKKGELVAQIDPTVYQAQLRQSEGDLASAEADVTLKRQNLERKKALVPLRAASQLDLDQAVAELAQAEATVTMRKAALESSQANLNYCTITAPVDGLQTNATSLQVTGTVDKSSNVLLNQQLLTLVPSQAGPFTFSTTLTPPEGPLTLTAVATDLAEFLERNPNALLSGRKPRTDKP